MKLQKYKKFFKEDNDFVVTFAYWIDPFGHIIPVYDNEKHITQVLSNPKAFGLDINEVKQIYELENESFNVEGKARERIIKELLMRGWIRIRRYFRPDMYTINVYRLNNKTKNFIYKWAKLMVDKKVLHTPVKIDTSQGVLQYSVLELSQDVLYNEHKSKKTKYSVKTVKSINDVPDKPIKKMLVK